MLIPDATSRQSHLYVFLSDSGLVKIGRSRAPMRRKWDLESNTGLRLYVVRILKNEGHQERAILAALSAYCHRGEWFRDSPEFRTAARAALGVDLKFRWAAKIDRDHKAEMAAAVRAICITGKTVDQVAAWDAAQDAYDEFFRGEITLEAFNATWTAAGHPPLSEDETKYGP
jgi:hypothetical protein